MKWRPWKRKQHAQLDERVQEARSEAALSQRRLESVRRNVTRPLQEAGDNNRFQDLIRRSLLEGHGR